MFCINCGTKLPDGAKFCFNCGAKLGELSSEMPVENAQNTKLVPAKCTNCGGQLTVDSNQQSAVCPFCETTFIVDQAINNYNISMKGNMNIGSATINVNGLNTENLVARAKSYENQNNFEMALEYFNKVLDIDVNNLEAVHGTYRIQQKMKNFVYIRHSFKPPIGPEVTWEFTKDKIRMIKGDGQETEEYLIKQIKNEKITDVFIASALRFNYPGKWTEVSIAFGRDRNKCKEVFNFIQNAKIGIYPDYK